jgi:hypothetical protein
VRARRIGFSPDSSSTLKLETESLSVFNPVLRRFATALSRVSITEASRCLLPRNAGADVFRLWEEVQSALSATMATSSANGAEFLLERYVREVDVQSGRVVSGRSWQTRAAATDGFVSVSPESLAAHGYRRSQADSVLYSAPDARTLTSEAFASRHCLRPVEDSRHPDLVGLAFSPHTRRDGDVAGVLWLERSSLGLRDLDFTYTALHSAGAGRQETADDSGHVRYEHLSTGGWIVSSWIIRIPVSGTVVTLVPAGGADLSGGAIMRRNVARTVARAWEIGGEVRQTVNHPDSSTRRSYSMGRVQGDLVTYGANAAVSDVAIILTSSNDTMVKSRVQTGANGHFVFDSVEAGNYLLTAYAPRLDTLNTPIPPLSLTVGERAVVTVTVTVPPPSAGISALCPGGIQPGSVGLYGSVRDDVTGLPVPGVRVRGYWLSNTIYNDAGVSTTQRERITTTDANGRYAFCDLEPTPRLLMTAALGVRHSLRTPALQMRPAEFRMYDMVITAAQ